MKTRPIPKLDSRAEERFRANFTTEVGCWNWKGFKSERGYGLFVIGNKNYRAHRVAYELFTGNKIPEGMVVDHLCRNTACVNPVHLEVVSIGGNTLRGVSLSAQNARKTHCLKGHELSGTNLVKRSRGDRQCRICVNERERQRRERKKS